MTYPEYTTEALWATAQENAVAFALIALSHIKNQGENMDELVTQAGQRLIPTWKTVKNDNARVFLQNIAFNITALGGRVENIDGDDTQAQATFSNWIRPEQAQAFGLTQEEADTWWNVFQPIATFIHLQYNWQKDANKIMVKITR